MTRKVQTLQTKLASAKGQPLQMASPRASSSVQPDVFLPSHLCPTSGAVTLNPTNLPDERSVVPPLPVIPEGISEVPLVSAGMKRRAPDDDERDSVPPEGHYSSDLHVRTPRLRRTLHGKQTGFTPVRNSTQTKVQISPSRRVITAILPSHTITDVTNSPRSTSHGEAQAKKRSWLGRVRSGGPASQNTSTSANPWTRDNS